MRLHSWIASKHTQCAPLLHSLGQFNLAPTCCDMCYFYVWCIWPPDICTTKNLSFIRNWSKCLYTKFQVNWMIYLPYNGRKYLTRPFSVKSRLYYIIYDMPTDLLPGKHVQVTCSFVEVSSGISHIMLVNTDVNVAWTTCTIAHYYALTYVKRLNDALHTTKPT